MNQQKSNTNFSEWLSTYFDANDSDKQQYLQSHFIPINISYEFQDFPSFLTARENLLRKYLTEAFPSDFNKIVQRYSLSNKLS